MGDPHDEWAEIVQEISFSRIGSKLGAHRRLTAKASSLRHNDYAHIIAESFEVIERMVYPLGFQWNRARDHLLQIQLALVGPFEQRRQLRCQMIRHADDFSLLIEHFFVR